MTTPPILSEEPEGSCWRGGTFSHSIYHWEAVSKNLWKTLNEIKYG